MAETDPGINLVGYLAGEFGVASASRVMSRMVRGAGLPLASTTVVTDIHRHDARPMTTLEGAPFELSILVLNADAMLHLWPDPQLHVHRERRRVGVWYWEVGVLPEAMRAAFSFVDEVWCATDHVKAALEPFADRPVVKHPLALTPTVPTALVRADLGLPDDRFLFGFAFDHLSVFERKNPIGLVRAYCDAFGPEDGAALVVKSIHGDRSPASAAQLRAAVGDRADVVLLDGFLSSIEMRAFFQLLDAYVSLHRAEGLGLTLAAAMAAGIPTIATGWSGNLEYMTEANSILVPYELREIGPGAEPYPADAVWAEPDPAAASNAMRRLFDDAALGTRLGARARSDLDAYAAYGVGAEWLLGRYEHLTGTKVPA